MEKNKNRAISVIKLSKMRANNIHANVFIKQTYLPLAIRYHFAAINIFGLYDILC